MAKTKPTKTKINKIAPPVVALAKRGPGRPRSLEPKLKKDGTPWKPWSEEVKERLAKKQDKIDRGESLPVGRKCSAMTTGVHGPKRPCDRWAVNGLTVCWIHGGSTKQAIEAAKRRLTEELHPTVARLVELRDQDAHLPTALGAATHLMNRVMGKPDSVDKDKGAGTPIVRIGMRIGGLPKDQDQLAVAIEVSPTGDIADEISSKHDIDAEFTRDNE